jgi:hypothetical protein
MSAHRQPTQLVLLAMVTAALAVLIALASPQGQQSANASGTPTTFLISRGIGGSQPNGPSTNPVISNDKRYARAVAFQSDASNLVRGDNNRATDVFVVKRTGHIGNEGAPWTIGATVLISRTGGHGPANGPSFSPSIDGAFHTAPTCVGFLSSASNIAAGDTNGQVDAFVAKISGSSRPRRLLPNGKQSSYPTTAVAVSGDCKSIAIINDGKLYVSKNGGRAKRVSAPGTAADPAYSTGLRDDLVFGAAGGVYLAKNSTHPKLVGRGGRNPVYNDIKRQVVAYEKNIGGYTQIAYHDIGKAERVISEGRGMGNGNSLDPVIGNSGYYVSFESSASNLSTNQGSYGDRNGTIDTYLYTDTRKITLATSLTPDGHVLPAGGENPSMSFYSNYVVFDTPSNLSDGTGQREVFMRYVGGK